MDLPVAAVDVVLRLLLAVASGAVLGWDREARGKPAGLRTNMMVALGAATFTLAATKLYEHSLQTGAEAPLDPLRVVQGVVGGLGFLGAGTIIQARGSVRGMTTAAAIWVVGALGVVCGLGYYMIAVTALTLAAVILVLIGLVEIRVFDDAAEEAET